MEKTNYAGIDYGCGTVNRNLETGIRFGVISQNDVGQAWFDESEAEYGKPLCPDCYRELDESIDFDDPDIDEEYYCSICEKGYDDDETLFPDEPLAFYYIGYDYKLFQSGGDTDIFIEKSPYYTYAQFCSPCAPGACYLKSPLTEPNDNNKCYCLGADWFEDEKAPYDVYDIKTNKLIKKGV